MGLDIRISYYSHSGCSGSAIILMLMGSGGTATSPNRLLSGKSSTNERGYIKVKNHARILDQMYATYILLSCQKL